jgi:hypothetical protein
MAKTPKKPPADPTTFSQAVFDRICERIARGESVRTICADPDMPASSAFYKWLAADEAGPRKLVEQYARARERQADFIFDEILEIADDGRNDFMIRAGGDDEDGIEVVNHENIQRSRLRIDARKWMAGKLAPKKYGDKVQAEHSVDGALADLLGAAASRPRLAT